MKGIWILASLFLLVWLSSMWFFWPLPMVVALFAGTVALATVAIEQTLAGFRARRM